MYKSLKANDPNQSEDSPGMGTYRAVVLLLQQGGHVPPDGHLLGQVLVLGTDPAPQLLQQAQQAGPPLGTGLQVGPVRGQRSEEVRKGGGRS